MASEIIKRLMDTPSSSHPNMYEPMNSKLHALHITYLGASPIRQLVVGYAFSSMTIILCMVIPFQQTISPAFLKVL